MFSNINNKIEAFILKNFIHINPYIACFLLFVPEISCIIWWFASQLIDIPFIYNNFLIFVLLVLILKCFLLTIWVKTVFKNIYKKLKHKEIDYKDFITTINANSILFLIYFAIVIYWYFFHTKQLEEYENFIGFNFLIFYILSAFSIGYRALDRLIIIIAKDRPCSEKEIEDSLLFKPWSFIKKRNHHLTPDKYLKLHRRIIKIIKFNNHFTQKNKPESTR